MKRTHINSVHRLPVHPRTGGAVIIIVLTLLSTLMFLGFFFFGFANQAHQAATNYASADMSRLDPDPLLDQALEQVLVGTRNGYEESALWGNRHSILSKIVGPLNRNLQPIANSFYGGTGMHLVLDDISAAQDGSLMGLAMDYDGDGIGDRENPGDAPLYPVYAQDGTGYYELASGGAYPRLNFSRIAVTGHTDDAFGQLTNTLPNNLRTPEFNPATGYTYPDLNSLFLAYDAQTLGPNGTQQRVVIPSFFRPQLLLSERRDAAGGNTAAFSNIYQNATTREFSLRPHAAHANLGSASVRFLSSAIQAQSGNTSRMLAPFPFTVDLDQDGNVNELGMFSYTDPASGKQSYYEYDFDADNDGVNDSIWLDLGLPMIDLPDGRQVVPLFAFKIMDADAKFNLNAHANLAGIYNHDSLIDPSTLPVFDRDGSGSPTPGDVVMPAHRSNMGLSSTEVNIAWGLLDTSLFDMVSSAQAEIQTAGLRIVQDLAPLQIAPALMAAQIPLTTTMAGIEAFNLIVGRIDAASNKVLEGRHGEGNLLIEYFGNPAGNRWFPRAGVTFDPSAATTVMDDDRDSLSAGMTGFISAYPMPYFNGTDWVTHNVSLPAAIHPLAMTGSGLSYLSYLNSTSGPGIRTLVQAIVPNPSTWVGYAGSGWVDQSQTGNGSPFFPQLPWIVSSINTATWPPVTAPAVAPTWAPGQIGTHENATNLMLIDEDDEIVSDSQLTNQADNRFPVSEMASLQMTDADRAMAGEVSRLMELVRFAFRDSQNATSNRKRFVTESWDRKEFVPPSPTGVRGWEYSEWTGTGFFGETFDPADRHFPPQFGTAEVGTAQDPMRPVLRRLLWTTAAGGSQTPNLTIAREQLQQKLKLNQLLVGFDETNQPVYRPLVPHPKFEATEVMTTAHLDMLALRTPQTGLTPDFTDINLTTLDGKVAAEWWARYDRQCLARDVYVLLWITSGGNDGNDYTVSLTPAAGTPSMPAPNGLETDSFDFSTPLGKLRVQEMAQFAVNLVDAMDHDDVITRFEYDPNLTDGWDDTLAHAQVAYGVEAQQLAFSETMLIVQPDNANDLNVTHHRDNDLGSGAGADRQWAHQWLFIELRNVSPTTVPLTTGSWRIVRVPRNREVGAADANVKAAFEFQTDPTSNNFKQIGPGGNFIIGCHDGSLTSSAGEEPAAFYANNASGDMALVVPRGPNYPAAPTNPPAPVVDLDLTSSHVDHLGYKNITDPYVSDAAPVGADTFNGLALVGKEGPDNPEFVNVQEFDLVLQRRRNLHAYGQGETVRDGGGVAQELWIEVDRMQVRGLNPLEITGDSASAVIEAFKGNPAAPTDPQPQRVASYERRQPLTRYGVRYGENDTQLNEHQKHTLYATGDPEHDSKNFAHIDPSSTALTRYTVWQPHFDRPFSSVMELLSIPLYGHVGNTSSYPDTEGYAPDLSPFVWGGTTYNLTTTPTPNTDGTARMMGHRTAGIRFLYPEPDIPQDLFDRQSSGTNALRHYRNRWHRFLEFVEVPDRTEMTIQDKLAKVRRTPGKINLNTLRDEAVLAGLVDDPFHLTMDGYLTNQNTQDLLDSGRIWYRHLLLSRDGVDPVFQEADSAATPVAIPGNINSQPFRDFAQSSANSDATTSILRADPTVTPGTTPKFGLFEARNIGDVTTDQVDYHTKNRLLAKVQNRTTGRSHVYYMWVGVGYFEAHRTAAGHVQIGAQAKDVPVRRAFAVADMSRIEEALVPDGATAGQFDFRKFIIYRKMIK